MTTRNMRSDLLHIEQLHDSPRRGLVEEIVHSLKCGIQSGALLVGNKLPTEAEIMRRHGVSRTVVREAIAHLQASSLVETRHGIGTFVLPTQRNAGFEFAMVDKGALPEILLMLELRMALETEAAALAARRRSESVQEAMKVHLHEFERAILNGTDPVSSDFSFHLEIANSTGNHLFPQMINHIRSTIFSQTMVITAFQASTAQLSSIWKVHSEHEAIYEAIRNQDPDSARAAMRTHLSCSRERLILSTGNANRPEIPTLT